MTILRIPVPKGVPSFSERVMLDKQQYTVDMHWNERAQRWYLQLYDSTGALIVTRKITPNWPLLGGLVHDARPPGELMAVDAQQLGTPIGLYDWDERVVLDYIEAADVAALIAGA